MSFQNKVIWITGASSGIGEGLAYAFAEQGASLILSSRKKEALEKVKSNCPGDTKVLILPLDVSDFESIQPTVDKALEHFPKIDILVNNAGISQRDLIENTDFEVDRKIMDVNYLGTVGLTKALLPQFIENRSGQIVVMSSVMGKFGAPYRSGYAASKHALQGYFDSLRAEIDKYNIKVTILCPGYVHTQVTINALKGDGSHNNVMAEATRNGLTPAQFATKALRIIASRKEEALIGGKEIYAVYVKRFFPSFFSSQVKKIKVK